MTHHPFYRPNPPNLAQQRLHNALLNQTPLVQKFVQSEIIRWKKWVVWIKSHRNQSKSRRHCLRRINWRSQIAREVEINWRATLCSKRLERRSSLPWKRAILLLRLTQFNLHLQSIPRRLNSLKSKSLIHLNQSQTSKNPRILPTLTVCQVSVDYYPNRQWRITRCTLRKKTPSQAPWIHHLKRKL